MDTYWAERQAKSQEVLSSKNIRDTEKQLKKYYSTAMKKVINNFEATYDKILAQQAAGVEITPALLYKLDTYWNLQGQLKQELQKLGDKQVALMSNKFVKQYFDIYNSIVIEGQAAFNTIDNAAARQVINSIWCADGKNWSQRVWNNTDKLQQTLNDKLVNSVVAGHKSGELKKILMDEFNVSYHRADSIVRTEIAHIQTQAARQRYQDYGIQEVQIWADADERRCDVCGGLHKKIYPVGAVMPIPAHTNCRCCIVPVID